MLLIPDIERPFFATAVSGIQQVAAEAGYRVMVCQSKESYQTEVSNVQAALEQWLALPEPPDAIFAINYTNAFNLILGLKKRGLRIPEDVAVVGFGDEFLASMTEPGLTTVNLHPYRIGQQAARLFLEQVQRQEPFQPRTFVITGALVIRQSSLKSKDENLKRHFLQ